MSDYFVRKNGKVLGPLSSSSLRKLASSGKIDEFSEISKSQNGPWKSASRVNGLEFKTVANYRPQAPVAAPAPTPIATQIVIQSPQPVRYQKPRVVYVRQRKSAMLAFLLTFCFGPLGMLYSTVIGALCMFIVGSVIGVISVMTLGIGLLLLIPFWIVCLLWAVMAC